MASLPQRAPDNQPADPQQRLLAFSVKQAEFQGPIPPPAMLSDYDRIIPRGAERIMAMAETQGAHRQHLEKQVVAENIAAQKRGQYFGFSIGMTTVLGGFGLVGFGKEEYGVAAIVTAVIGLVSVFVYGRHKEGKERQSKMESLPPQLK